MSDVLLRPLRPLLLSLAVLLWCACSPNSEPPLSADSNSPTTPQAELSDFVGPWAAGEDHLFEVLPDLSVETVDREGELVERMMQPGHVMAGLDEQQKKRTLRSILELESGPTRRDGVWTSKREGRRYERLEADEAARHPLFVHLRARKGGLLGTEEPKGILGELSACSGRACEFDAHHPPAKTPRGRVHVQGNLRSPDQGTIRQGELKVEGALDSFEVRGSILMQEKGLYACYDEGLSRTPTLEGQLDLQFQVGGAGQVESVKLAGSTVEDERVQACVIETVEGWRFSRARAGMSTAVALAIILELPS